MGLEVGFFSIPVNNLQRAREFYQKVMGWSFETRDDDFHYAVSNGNVIGAIESVSDSFRASGQGPKMYFRAMAMKSTLENVEPAGGTVSVDSTPVMGGERGYTAEINDPFGNRLAFWAPEP